MAQKEKLTKVPTYFGDIALTAIAVSIVSLTFFGVSGLTPKKNISGTSASVLGVSTRQRALTYFPAQTIQLPFVNNYSLSGNTSLDGNAVITITYNPLEASTYEFSAVTFKNSSLEYKKLQLNPIYSLDGSYTQISITYAGQKTEIISVDGVMNPLELVVPPSSSTELLITVQPTVRLVTPVTLSLVFTEVP